ncbi:VPS54 [Cordylochernes scorpioides]|uniref:VPS54 n=1 Tax=Cordylochernes scorpioides TaxID=51811 RepID=A0ABY6LAW3_9ARAC|nr:VPS54 [Cordylochernes scorpioides]
MFGDYLRKIARKHYSLKKPKKQEVTAIPPCPLNFSERRFPEIDNVPNVFLRQDFTLENLETFNQVLPWNYFEQMGDSPRLSSKLLQEKLSYYLDVVEVQIVRQISRRSQEFFNAMTSHDALKDQLATVLQSVLDLRKKIRAIDEAIVQSSLQVLALKRRRDNYAKVYSKLQLMATLHQTQPTVQLLLSTSDYVGALDLIKTSQEVLQRELPGVVSFRHLGSQLQEIQKVIHKMMDTDFSRYVAADLNRPLEEEDPSSVMEEVTSPSTFNFSKKIAKFFKKSQLHQSDDSSATSL